jgi:CheY-like chemotaxis protein
MTSLLLGTKLNPEQRDYVETIRASGEHLLNVINDILDFSKIEAGKMTIEPIDFSLEDMLGNVIGLLWEKADEKGLELLLEIDTTIPDNLNGDALRIGQVLINFTGNAVKFTETGDVILRVKKIHENNHSVRLRFEVQDTGIGIPPERFNQLFKPFHQLDTSSTRRFEGTGLGLTISKNLVELMDGKLDISSEAGVGSTFSLELSLDKGAVQDIVSYRKISLQECRVLVVDDNQHARDILSHMLRALSIDVTEANSGAAALDIINTQNAMGKTFNIIFLDWKMPGMSGIETAERINNLTLITQPKLVLVSAHSNHEIGSTIENLLGAILSKPVTPSALHDTVTSLLKNSNVKNEHNLTLDINLYKNLAGSRVLLVDDNEINQDVVKELLGLVGANITVASNGQQALLCLKQTQFDVILMDVQMPVMDGMEATRQIRAQPQFSTLPIIAMTANARSDDREKCMNAGMNDYVSKPINPEILFRTLSRWHNNNTQLPLNNQPTFPPDRQQNIILSNLYKINNLEVDLALERLLNNKTFYLKLIERFANERSNTVELIETALKENNQEEAIRQAHTFKSLAGTVGAVELQEIALQIEMGLHEQQDISDSLINLRIKLRNFVSAIYTSLTIR